jgi:hypothetical protein
MHVARAATPVVLANAHERHSLIEQTINEPPLPRNDLHDKGAWKRPLGS